MVLGGIARQAWRMTWRHKPLWAFGLFAAAGGGSGGLQAGLPGLEAGLLWALVGGAGLVGLAALTLHVLSDAALIDAARRVRAGEAPRAGEELAAGAAAFWRVLRVKLLAAGAFLALGAALAAPALLAVAGVLEPLPAILLGLAVAAAVLPPLVLAYVTYAYALRFAVVEGVGAAESARRAWAFLHGRLLETLQLLVLAFLGQVGGALAAALAVAPGALVGLGCWLATGEVWLGVAAGMALGVPPAVVVAGAAGTFRSGVWTMGFLESREAAHP